MKKCLLFFLVYVLTGCAAYIHGYIPNEKENSIMIDKEKRKDIAFSISYDSQIGNELSGYIQKTMIDDIKDTFGKSQLFGRVHYLPYSDKNKYHYHFDIKLSGANPSEQSEKGTLIGLTLGLIPISINYYVDITMFVFENGKEVYSITAPEEVSNVYWLPLIIVSPFMNYYSAVPRVLNKSNRYFLQKIVENKLY